MAILIEQGIWTKVNVALGHEQYIFGRGSHIIEEFKTKKYLYYIIVILPNRNHHPDDSLTHCDFISSYRQSWTCYYSLNN